MAHGELLKIRFLVTATIFGLIGSYASIKSCVDGASKSDIRALSQQLEVLFEQTQGGQILEKSTLTGFGKEVEEALSEQRNQTTDYFKAAEHDFAAGLYRTAVSNYQKSISVIPTMSAYLNLGISHFYLSKYDKADEALTSGLKIAVQKQDKELEATLRNGLGNVYFNQGKYEDALKYHQEALTIHKDIGNPLGLAFDLGNLGSVYFNQGKYEDALKYYKDALTIHNNIGNPLGQANALNNIGNVYFNQGKYEDALKYHQDALTIHKDIGNPLGQASDLGNLGNVYFNQGKYDDALKRLNEARTILSKIGATGALRLVERMISQLETAMK